MLDVILTLGPLTEHVVVSAAATELPESQVGAPVTVLDHNLLESLNKPDLLEALRLVPGIQVQQTGQRGGTTSVFVRGGNANFNKVIIDGIPVNDIGGSFDFANLSVTGVGLLLSATVGLFGYQESLAITDAQTSLMVEFIGAALLAGAAAVLATYPQRRPARS